MSRQERLQAAYHSKRRWERVEATAIAELSRFETRLERAEVQGGKRISCHERACWYIWNLRAGTTAIPTTSWDLLERIGTILPRKILSFKDSGGPLERSGTH